MDAHLPETELLRQNSGNLAENYPSTPTHGNAHPGLTIAVTSSGRPSNGSPRTDFTPLQVADGP